MIRRLFSQAELLPKWTSIKDSKITQVQSKLSEFQLKKVKVLTEAISTLNPEEKDYLWRKVRDSYIEMLGVDPALMSDFFPKMQENQIDFSSIQVPLSSPAGMVEAARGKIKPIERKTEPKAEPAKEAKDSKAGSKGPEKPDQGKKPQEKPQDKQNPKDKKK